ncbi:MAG: TIM barrel protein [Lachnospiraceae bacterium]
MIRFGPSGNSDEFYQEGYKSTFQAMKWVHDKGLTAYEYSFGRGVRMGEQSAAQLREEARKYDVVLSAHAPFFINLATDDEEKMQKNLLYFREVSNAAKMMGADRVVFHPGSCAKVERAWAVKQSVSNFKTVLKAMDEEGFSDLIYCPETLGKINQVGDLEEVISLCNIDDRVLPTIDFGHLHARGIGAINSRGDFENILTILINKIGHERTSNMHVHFAKIAYTKMGERAHVTFADSEFGPDFSQLAPMLIKYKLEPRIICESKGTMAMDACAMKEIYNTALTEAKS